jgi:hypothetical protein
MDDKDAQRRRRREDTKERISDDFTGCENSGSSGKLIPCRRSKQRLRPVNSSVKMELEGK